MSEACDKMDQGDNKLERVSPEALQSSDVQFGCNPPPHADVDVKNIFE